ncbi:hypothetical protein BJ508DRAFT_309067 [Ascobolus immersus RN42]|uniref:Uncharacterized protein n=1 Tax=Ascobolus immersus RN42 TaxID=1160509 RepID=A0A3N4HZN2_ASCIM|nr:hypothetical protein BJ508DRAFT_309067 [Ascobolus immersus RN42]
MVITTRSRARQQRSHEPDYAVIPPSPPNNNQTNVANPSNTPHFRNRAAISPASTQYQPTIPAIPPAITHHRLADLTPQTTKSAVVLRLRLCIPPAYSNHAIAHDGFNYANIIGLDLAASSYIRPFLEQNANRWFILEGSHVHSVVPHSTPLLYLLSVVDAGYEDADAEVPNWTERASICPHCKSWAHTDPSSSWPEGYDVVLREPQSERLMWCCDGEIRAFGGPVDRLRNEGIIIHEVLT